MHEYITFEGPVDREPCLRRFIAELRSDKKKYGGDYPIVNEPERGRLINDSKWLEIIDETVLLNLTKEGNWGFEDILDCLLTGEYELLDMEFDAGHGRVSFEPLAFPFGGTDPIKGMIASFGFIVTGDSFLEGLA